MKSLLFCTSYIRDAEAWKQRYQRWLDYYTDGPIDADFRLMIDDGSPYLPPPDVIRTVHHAAPLALAGGGSALVHFDENLGRQSMVAYPGWWRSFLHAVVLARELGVDKIVHIESDAYILSPRLADYINGVDAGWHVMWTDRYQFPETAIQVICRDQFDALEAFKARQPDLNYGELAEKILPFTTVARQFKGDRYSEIRRNRGIFRSRKFDRFQVFQSPFFYAPIPADADFVTQAIPAQRFAFGRKD